MNSKKVVEVLLLSDTIKLTHTNIDKYNVRTHECMVDEKKERKR